MSQPDKLPTRRETEIILKSRGYKKSETPGVWFDPAGEKIAWFPALTREKIKFDKKDKPAPLPISNDNQPFQ